MAQINPDLSPQPVKPRERPKNREVENEMIGWVGCKGEAPHSATEPVTDEQKNDGEFTDCASPEGTDGARAG